jgi:hypothetical protein
MSALFAIGACGALLFLAGVLHVPITPVTAAIGVLAAIAMSVRGRRKTKWSIADVALLIPIAIVIAAGAIVPLHDFDGRAFWMLKAKGIAHDHSIDGPFFQHEEMDAPRNDYPLLMPLDAATVMLLTGSLDDRVPRFVFIAVFVAFAWMVRDEIGPWAAALLVWIPAFSVMPDGGATSAYCDIALAAFVGGAFIELARGESAWRFGMWVAFVALTKREGLPIAIVLLVVGTFVLRKATSLVAPVIAVIALIVWRARVAPGDEENLFTLASTLPQKVHRIPGAIAGLAKHLVSPMWGLIWCAALVALAVLALRRQWRDFALAALVIGGGFAVMIFAYTITTWPQMDLVNSSADRLLMHIVAPALYALRRSTLPT